MSDEPITAESPPPDDEDPITAAAYPAILGELGKDPVVSVRSTRLKNPRFQDRESRIRYAEPRSVYMIYMKVDNGGRLVVKHLYEHDFTDSLRLAEERLFYAATHNGATIGANFREIVWQRPYYLTFIIDNPGWEFYWGVDGKEDPIRFLYRKPGSTQLYITKNYTFAEAKRAPSLGSGDAFRMINFHLNEAGNPVPSGRTEKYCFQLYLQTPFAILNNPPTHIVLIVDPDGQNQGPRI